MVWIPVQDQTGYLPTLSWPRSLFCFYAYVCSHHVVGCHQKDIEPGCSWWSTEIKTWFVSGGVASTSTMLSMIPVMVKYLRSERKPIDWTIYQSSDVTLFPASFMILLICSWQSLSGKILCLVVVKYGFDLEQAASWSEFNQYPAYDSFLKSVEQEAVQNVKRLRHHPSVVIFGAFSSHPCAYVDRNSTISAGNNEGMAHTFPICSSSLCGLQIIKLRSH